MYPDRDDLRSLRARFQAPAARVRLRADGVAPGPKDRIGQLPQGASDTPTQYYMPVIRLVGGDGGLCHTRRIP